MLKNIVFGCVVRSENRIDILNARSIGKEHLNIFIDERFIEKLKKLRRSHQRCSIKSFS